MQLASVSAADLCLLEQPSFKPDSFPSGLKVLLCEGQSSADTSAVRELYAVTHAHDVQQAIHLLQEHSRHDHFDLVLVDMAQLDSDLTSAAADAMFQAAASSGTSLVLMCQHYTEAAVMTAVQAGAADILGRPLSPTTVKNLWQHTVRAAMTNSKSASTRHSSQHSTQCLQEQEQQQIKHSPAAGATPGQLSSPLCCGLLDDGLMDGLGGLDLPPLVPSQLEFDPDSMLISDLQASDPSNLTHASSLHDLLPPSSPSNSNAATAVAASLFRCSSEQQISGGTTFTAPAATTATELESCADASSPVSRRKLRACTRLRSMASAPAATGCCDWTAAAGSSFPPGQPAVGCPMPMNMGMAGSQPSGQWTGPPCWGMNMNMGMGMGMAMRVPPLPGPQGCGMVWGMPVPHVAVAPGIAVPPQQPATTSGSAGGSSAGEHRRNSSSRAEAAAGDSAPWQQTACPMPLPAAMLPPMWGGVWPPYCYPMWQHNPHGMLMMMPQNPSMGAAGPAAAPAAAHGMAAAQPSAGSSNSQQQQQDC